MKIDVDLTVGVVVDKEGRFIGVFDNPMTAILWCNYNEELAGQAMGKSGMKVVPIKPTEWKRPK